MFFIKLHVYTCLIKYCLCSLFPSFVRNFLCRGTTQDEVRLHIIIACACVLFCFIIFATQNMYVLCTVCVCHGSILCLVYEFVGILQCYMWIINGVEF